MSTTTATAKTASATRTRRIFDDDKNINNGNNNNKCNKESILFHDNEPSMSINDINNDMHSSTNDSTDYYDDVFYADVSFQMLAIDSNSNINK